MDLKKASLDYLMDKFKKCHDEIWEGGKRDPAVAFDVMGKLMFSKIYDERFTKKGEPYDFQIGKNEDEEIIGERVRTIYDEVRDKEPDVFGEPIKITDDIIFKVVRHLQDISLLKTDLDAKGRAFESFLGQLFRGEYGQFFTPREIVDSMVDMVDPLERDLVMDPACGSGGFLLYSIKKIREKLKENYSSDEETIKRLDYDFSHDQVFGIEINERIARIAMMDMVIHDDGHTNIERNDGLIEYSSYDPRRDINPSKYSVVFTNPPFGAYEDREEILDKFELGSGRKRQRKETLFLERCIDLLEPRGTLAIVLPDGELNNPSCTYKRDYIRKNTILKGIISLPREAFQPFGAGDLTNILILEKKPEEVSLNQYEIFMEISENVGYDATGEPQKGEDLSKIVEEYGSFRDEGKTQMNVVSSTELEDRLDPKYYHPKFLWVEDRLEESPHSVERLGDIAKNIQKGKRPSGVDYVEEGTPFIRIEDMGEKGKDEMKLYEAVKIPDEYKEKDKFTSALVEKDDILMAVTGATIGKVLIINDENFEGLICPDIVKIRLREDVIPLYAYAFLQSKFGQAQIQRRIHGSTNLHLSPNYVKEIKLPIPPKKKQEKFAENLLDAFEKSEKLKKKANKVVKDSKREIKELIMP